MEKDKKDRGIGKNNLLKLMKFIKKQKSNNDTTTELINKK